MLLRWIVKVDVGVEAADEKTSLATLWAIITRLRDKVLGFEEGLDRTRGAVVRAEIGEFVPGPLGDPHPSQIRDESGHDH